MLGNDMFAAGLILSCTLLVFALGKSPLFRVDRAGAAIIGASLTIAIHVLSFDQATKVIDYRTIVLLFSMMIVTANLKLSGFFQLIGNNLLQLQLTKRQFLLAVILASGGLSAFFINDIICLLFTPIVLLICQRAGLIPIPYLIGLATASNIGSAATLIGNPQNILIGSLSGISFISYLVLALPVTLLGLLLNYWVLVWVYKDNLNGELASVEPIKGVYHRYLISKSLVVTVGILIGFVVGVEPVVVASLGAAYLLVTRRLKPNKIYASIDFNLLVIFIGLFVVVGGVEQSGFMFWLLGKLSFLDFSNFSLFALLTVVLSNIFSNVPAVMLLKFFIPANADQIWWAGMAVFSTLAGNLTLTGSIANLIVVEMAKKEGVNVSFFTYLKVGLPLTVLLTGLSLLYFNLII